ncbi:MAG: D-alanyl-D-alanine carboxypeptidase, partial [Clostridia bacterium]|nr:D-alanyl-D-alanine carboxypeptidase [Clostridia bacterium]
MAWNSIPAEESVQTATGTALTVGGKSAILIDFTSGKVLFQKNEHEKLPIASVTKIMTLLLVMEALDNGMISLTDSVTCSAEAASMGGSQIWLEPGEVMSVHDLVKAAAVVSANDACAALAEHVAGSVEEFVARMNTRAAELGMNDTHFLDCSGLNDEAYSCAYDVAVMSRELMKHPTIKQYTTIWMDTLRDGQSQLVNTNKLVRFYEGITGLKTGTTATAGHNLAATAERNGLALGAVMLGCTTTAERFGGARTLLDYGFAN